LYRVVVDETPFSGRFRVRDAADKKNLDSLLTNSDSNSVLHLEIEKEHQMKSARFSPTLLSIVVPLAAGCGGNSTPPPSPATRAACVPATKPEFSYVLTGYAVSMFTVDSCTGQFTATSPATVPTGYSSPQDKAEQMVTDPLGRFAYVANLVSNVSDLATISMYTINATTGTLSPTTPATVPTGFLPQEIAIDPLGRFVYTANSDDSSVSMFTINQSTGALTPTAPASVSTLIPGELLSIPSFLTVDPTGRFLYVTASLSNGSAVFMYTINQTNGFLTPTSPATVVTGGTPFQVVVDPSDKFAYVVNNLSGGEMTDGVWQYTINSATGVLTQNAQAAVAAGNAPTAIAVDPTSRFAYVVNRIDNTVSMYTIDPKTGSLTPNSATGNPAAAIATGVQPFRIGFDPTGKFVYVTNEGSAASIYTVNNDGTLTNAGATGVATGGLSTAITGVSQ
jgi:6-phosphogluconolactonase